MAFIKCSGCETMIEIPPELCDEEGEQILSEPYYCDACERTALDAVDDGSDPSTYCEHCGKDFEDFSDLGCEFCDTRIYLNNL